MLHPTGHLNPPQPAAAFAQAQDVFHPRELRRAEVLYREGDPAEGVFRVEEGLLKLSTDLPSGRERVLGLAGPGDVIGALLPAQAHYQETAEALSPRVRLAAASPGAAVAELQQAAVGAQLGRLREALADHDLPVPARLARTFLRLGERFGTKTASRTVHLTLPLTHDTLAGLVGAARETTTTALGEMREAGVLEGTRGRYRYAEGALSAYAASHAALS